MDQDLMSYLKEQFQEIRQRSERMEGRLEHVEGQVGGLREEVGGLREESREGIRHAHVLLEDVRGNVRLLAEGVASVDERMGKLDGDLRQKLEELWNLVATPFRGLETRVTLLEEAEDRRHRDIMEVMRKRFGSRLGT